MKSLASVLLVLVGACGGGDPATPDAPAAAPDAPPAPDEGLVIVTESLLANGLDTSVGVFLGDGPLLGGPTGSASGCDFYPRSNQPGQSAGVVTITGTTVDVTATPDGTTPPVVYTTGLLPDNLYEPGATLTVTAAGATVPAFAGTVTGPAALAGVTLPAAVSRATPPSITWTADTADEVWIQVLARSDGSVLWCRTSDAGTYSVPTDAMAMLPTATAEALVVVRRVNKSTVIAGRWSVALAAESLHAGDWVPVGP